MSVYDLKVRHAEKLAKELRVDGVIIIAFPIADRPRECAGVSYGETKAKCRQIGKILDEIYDALGDGRIPQEPTTRRGQDGHETK